MFTLREPVQFFSGIVLCLFGLLFSYTRNALALELPEIYFTDYRLDRTQIDPGGKTNGTVSLWNYEPGPASDLRLRFLLLQTTGQASKIIDSRYGDSFTLSQKEKKTISFSYWMPYKLPEAGPPGFVLRVSVENSLGTVLAWSDETVESTSTGIFYDLAYLGEENAANPGLLDPDSSPDVRFLLTRPAVLSRSDMIAQVIRFTTTFQGGQPYSETEQPLVYGMDERTTIIYKLPPFTESGRYKTTVKIVNKGSGDFFSNSLEYSWIVKDAMGNAQIFFALLNKETYSADAIASLKVGFAAYKWDKNPSKNNLIVARIFDKSGEMAGEKSQPFQLSEREMFLRIPLIKEARDPKVAIQVIIDGRIAGVYEFLANNQKKDGSNDEERAGFPVPALPGFWSLFFARFSLYIAIFSGALLAGAAIYFFKVLRPAMKKKKKEKKKANKKKALDSEALGDLLDQFNEIDKLNQRFKSPK